MRRDFVNTVTGQVPVTELGPTLMHEHILCGFAGWTADTLRPGPTREECVSVALDRIRQLQDRGIKSMVDPCPNDLGRDVELMAEVSAVSGFQIVCATGLYREGLGGAAYWRFREFSDFSQGHENGVVQDLAALFIRELTEGIGHTGVRAGVIKVASGYEGISHYERQVMKAAALASIETGAPIMTHTEGGRCGDQQQALLVELGVDPHRIIIGHSCNNRDLSYHLGILEGGSYIGFDQLGSGRLFDFEGAVSDEEKMDMLVTLLARGCGRRIILSQDTVWCWRGEPLPLRTPSVAEKIHAFSQPTYLHDYLIPRMLSKGVSPEDINVMLVDNPRRYFSCSTRL